MRLNNGSPQNQTKFFTPAKLGVHPINIGLHPGRTGCTSSSIWTLAGAVKCIVKKPIFIRIKAVYRNVPPIIYTVSQTTVAPAFSSSNDSWFPGPGGFFPTGVQEEFSTPSYVQLFFVLSVYFYIIHDEKPDAIEERVANDKDNEYTAQFFKLIGIYMDKCIGDDEHNRMCHTQDGTDLMQKSYCEESFSPK